MKLYYFYTLKAIGKKLYSSEEEKANKKGKLKLPEASNNSKNSQEFESS